MLYKGRGDQTQHMGIAYADSVRAFLKNQWQMVPVIFAAIVVCRCFYVFDFDFDDFILFGGCLYTSGGIYIYMLLRALNVDVHRILVSSRLTGRTRGTTLG